MVGKKMSRLARLPLAPHAVPDAWDFARVIHGRSQPGPADLQGSSMKKHLFALSLIAYRLG